MDKKVKKALNYGLIFIFVIILPNLFFNYFDREDKELFYERVNKEEEICLQRAERDSLDKKWCSEIRKASITNFQTTIFSQNTRNLMLFLQPILFVLLISQYNLRKEVEELKQKIND
ncbi:MAG TPA: hypothetical protein PKY59_20730 [Pyrinomonadaceae bacterium]|nr:hypothetical protein [Pyrinomonadaceae bacterium]